MGFHFESVNLGNVVKIFGNQSDNYTCAWIAGYKSPNQIDLIVRVLSDMYK
jgi:hypothetical protein